LKEQGYDPFFVFTYLSGKEYDHYKVLVELLDSVIIALGFSATAPKKLQNSAAYFRYLLLGRAIRSLRTIREMYVTRYDDDCLSIARAVYEAYLRMKILRLAPATAERFEAMLAHEVGAYHTKIKRNGKPDYDACIDPETGKEFNVSISNRETVQISDLSIEEPLYYELYPLLSGFVHPDLVQDALQSVQKNDAAVVRKNDPVLAIILVQTVCFLLLVETMKSDFLTIRTKRDLRHVAKHLCEKLLHLLTSDTILKRQGVPESVYRFSDCVSNGRTRPMPKNLFNSAWRRRSSMAMYSRRILSRELDHELRNRFQCWRRAPNAYCKNKDALAHNLAPLGPDVELNADDARTRR
jgi:hypothetical protein